MREILKKIVVFVLTWEAGLILKKYKPKIVAVTGSVGKTSTKDAIFKVLEKKYNARKSEKSYNSDLGVPLTIIGSESGWGSVSKWSGIIWKGIKLFLKRSPYPEILVLEVGADRPGDIKKIRRLITPDVAVLTQLAETPVHIEFFADAEEVFKEKSELVAGLGTERKVILNFDDKEIMKMREKAEAQISTYGLCAGADIKASGYKIFYQKEGRKSVPEGIEFNIKTGSEEFEVRIRGAFGKHQVYPALAALAVASALEIKLEDSVESLSLYSPPPGRLKILKGIKDTLILDDTYNSSPKALEAALEVLDQLKAKRKIAVLGDMLELGKHTITAHRDLGKVAAGVADIICMVGVWAKFFMEGALKEGFKKKTIYTFESSDAAGAELEKLIEPGDLILVKGSQGIRMEKIVEKIMAEPEKKGELLCRQDKAWQAR